jgi:hypothetical protein
MEEKYKEKYLKYKYKYIELKKQRGGFEGNVEKYKNISKDTKITNIGLLESLLGKNTINALETISCKNYHRKLTDYIITEKSLEKLSQTEEFRDTILYHYYNSEKKPRLVEIFLESKCVPSRMANFFPKEIIDKLKIFVDKIKPEDIRKFITDNIGNTFGQTENLTKLIEQLMNLINDNVKNAIKYLFLTDKYELNGVIWDHFSALLEFILCLYNCTSINIKKESIPVLDFYNKSTLYIFNSSINSGKDSLNAYLNIDEIKKNIEFYTSQLPVKFVFLDKITNLTDKCANILSISEHFNLQNMEEKDLTMEEKDLTRKKYEKLKDFLTPYGEKLYISPSVLFFLSMKLNNKGMKIENNYYLKPLEENDINLWTNRYKLKRDSDKVPIFSFYEYIWTFTLELYETCAFKQIKDDIKENKQIIKESSSKKSDFFRRFFGKKSKSYGDDISIETIESVESIKSEDITNDFLKKIEELEEYKLELEKLNNSTFMKKILKYILEKLKIELSSLHNKICKKEDLIMSDFDSILGVINESDGKLGKLLKSKFVKNYLISTLSLYTAFLPFDITDYDIMGYEKETLKKRYIDKYKFYETNFNNLFKEKYFKEINKKKFYYNQPLNPPYFLYEEIKNRWAELYNKDNKIVYSN